MAAYGSELSRLVDELNRSTAATRTGENASIDRLLALAVQRGASDILLVAGSAIALRVKGSLHQLPASHCRQKSFVACCSPC